MSRIEQTDADVKYWGLTPAQRVRFYGRVRDYYAAHATRNARRALRFAYVGLAIQAATIAYVVIIALVRWWR